MKNKKQPSAILSDLHPDYIRHFGVVLENIDSKFDYLVDGLRTTNEKMDKGFQEAKDNLNDFKMETRQNFKEVFGRLNNLETRADQTDNNFKQIFKYLSRIIEAELAHRKAMA